MPTIRRSQAEIRKTGGRVDLKRVRATTDKDIMRWIAEDPDTAPELPSKVKPRIVYTPRGEVRRIISARPASRRERNAYHQTFTSRNP